MEQEKIKEISKKNNIKENMAEIMFEKIKDMGYNIKDFNNLVTEYYKNKICY